MVFKGLFGKREKIILKSKGASIVDNIVTKDNGNSIRPILSLHNNINIYSDILRLPDIVYNIIMNLSESRFFRLNVEGSISATLENLATKASGYLKSAGPYYLYAGSQDGVSIRSLIYNHRIIAIVLEEGGNIYKGVEALEELARLRGSYNASISRIRTRIVEWKPEYSVGISVLDKQHATFFEIINSIFESMVTGLFEDKGDNIMRELRMYTQGHFKSEEGIMEKYHYPDELFNEHKKHHNLFRNAINSYYEEYISTGNRIAIAARLFDVTRSWLKDHILRVDKKYEEYFRLAGIKIRE